MKSSCMYACYRKNNHLLVKIPKKPDEIKLVFFDMDGVLTDTMSSWKYIHDHFGTTNERSVEAYLKGSIDDMEFIRRDVSLWKEGKLLPTKNTIRDILYEIPLIEGSKECIAYFHTHHVKTAIVSAGLDILAEKVAQELGIDYVFANGIKNDTTGRLTGEGILRVQLKHKEKAVQQLAEELHISLENCAAVGNSCFDVPMFEICGIGIAFNPGDSCVRNAADVIIEGKDLRKIIPPLERYIREKR